MPSVIAIQPDDYSSSSTPEKTDASSPRWAHAIERAGHRVRWVNVRRAEILREIDGCAGFMWRWAHFGGMGEIARRLLPVIERELGLTVYPDQNTCWHYDDKIAQTFLLDSLGIPTPTTWIWFDAESACDWARNASYPVVLKLTTGAGSTNVRLIHSSDEAIKWIGRLFRKGVVSLNRPRGAFGNCGKSMVRAILGRRFFQPLPQRQYALFQEFLPGNHYDTRVTIIGDRAFAYRRHNRPNDFRASGSGNFDTDPQAIDERFVRLAFQTARAIRSQSCAIDGLYRHSEPVTTEMSYTYVSWMVHCCPGHWKLHGGWRDGALVWRDGPMWPEDAQVSDFLRRLESQIQIAA